MLADEDGLKEGMLQRENILERMSPLYKDVKTACQEGVAGNFFLGMYGVGRDGRLCFAIL